MKLSAKLFLTLTLATSLFCCDLVEAGSRRGSSSRKSSFSRNLRSSSSRSSSNNRGSFLSRGKSTSSSRGSSSSFKRSTTPSRTQLVNRKPTQKFPTASSQTPFGKRPVLRPGKPPIVRPGKPPVVTKPNFPPITRPGKPPIVTKPFPRPLPGPFPKPLPKPFPKPLPKPIPKPIPGGHDHYCPPPIIIGSFGPPPVACSSCVTSVCQPGLACPPAGPVAPEVVEGAAIPQLIVNATNTLEAAGLGEIQGSAVLEISGIALPIPVASWTDQGLTLDVPMIGLTQPTEAKLFLFDAETQVIAEIPVQLLTRDMAGIAAAE